MCLFVTGALLVMIGNVDGGDHKSSNQGRKGAIHNYGGTILNWSNLRDVFDPHRYMYCW